MSASYRYTTHDGRRYCYAVEPTYRCPLADAVPEEVTDVPEAIVAAAAALGSDAYLLARALRKAHTGMLATDGGRQREDGKLTDRCRCCGARMERLGFRVWIEEPLDPDSTKGRISSRLGFNGYQQVDGSSRYFPTKARARDFVFDGAKGLIA